MCNKVEEFAKEYARDCKIITAIEIGLQFNITQEQIISSICNKYGLPKEEAMEYYEEVALQPV
jgi:hypothetical protein